MFVGHRVAAAPLSWPNVVPVGGVTVTTALVAAEGPMFVIDIWTFACRPGSTLLSGGTLTVAFSVAAAAAVVASAPVAAVCSLPAVAVMLGVQVFGCVVGLSEIRTET